MAFDVKVLLKDREARASLALASMQEGMKKVARPFNETPASACGLVRRKTCPRPGKPLSEHICRVRMPHMTKRCLFVRLCVTSHVQLFN